MAENGIININAAQNYLQVQVVKYRNKGIREVSEKLKCDPTREAVLERVKLVYTNPKKIDEVMEAIDRCEEERRKRQNKKMKKHAAKQNAALAEANAANIADSSQQNTELQLLTLDTQVDRKLTPNEEAKLRLDECRENLRAAETRYCNTKERLDGIRTKSEKHLEYVQELCSKLRAAFKESKLMKKEACDVAKELEGCEEKLIQLSEKAVQLKAEYERAQAIHYTFYSRCISDICKMVEEDVKKAAENDAKNIIIQFVSRAERYTDDFLDALNTIATLDEVKQIALYQAITDKVQDEQGKQTIWHFDEKCTIADLLEFAKMNVVIDEKE